MENKAALLALTPEESGKMKYEDLCALRCKAYGEHVAGMILPDSLETWNSLMKERYAPKVQVWANVFDSYIVALMVVRYGEAIEHWPDMVSKNDLKCAADWYEGKKQPLGVSIPGQGIGESLRKLLLGALAALAIGLSVWLDPALLLVSLPVLGTALTDFFENKLVDNFFRTTTYARPTVLGVALFTAAPGETGGGTEVSGGSYARVDHPPLNTNWNATQGGTSGNSSGTGGLTDNATDITFPAPTANWGTVSHFAIFDATSGGNMLIYGALGTSKTVNNGDPAPKFTAGDLDITFA